MLMCVVSGLTEERGVSVLRLGCHWRSVRILKRKEMFDEIEGVADLVLLPIEQYRKDGRVMRGMQKGATSFVKTTAIEALTIGARLANGTQIVLEQAEGILSGRNTSASAQAELESSLFLWNEDNELDEEDAEYGYGGGGEDFENMTMSVADLSRYAHQPTNVKEGVHAAYKSLGKNLGEAAQTILAVPIEVYERSGTEVRLAVRLCSRRRVLNSPFDTLVGSSACRDTSIARRGAETYDWCE